MTFRPLLAATAEALDGCAPLGITYPVFVSPKLDGIRAIKIAGVLMSRTLKPIPSSQAQDLIRALPDGVDGECIVGMPNDDPYRRTESAIMRRHGLSPAAIGYYVFDNYLLPGGFQERFRAIERYPLPPNVFIVPHVVAHSPEQLLALEERFLNEGFEGAMIRGLSGSYKHGRSTVREGILLKLKRFRDAEAIIIGAYEQMHNANIAETNNLGHTERSTRKAGMQPTGMLGGFHVRDMETGVKFDVSSSTIPVLERPAMWVNRKSYEGKILTYKFFPSGSKERPRFPTFKGWRSKDDISA